MGGIKEERLYEEYLFNADKTDFRNKQDDEHTSFMKEETEIKYSDFVNGDIGFTLLDILGPNLSFASKCRFSFFKIIGVPILLKVSRITVCSRCILFQ